MSFNSVRLAFNLFFTPLIFFILAMVASSAVDRFENRPMLEPLAALIHWGSVGLFVAAVATLGWSIWIVSQAVRGVGELCHNCGMPTRFISPGRYSPHYRCMACGANRRA